MPPRLCEICGEQIFDDQSYVEDFFGGASHSDCLEAVEVEDEDERE